MFLMLPTTSLWKSYVLNDDTQQQAYAILAKQHSQQHQQHNYSISELFNNSLMELAYGKVMFLMLPHNNSLMEGLRS